MTMTKQETIAQLKRKIERLEAQLAEMKASADKSFAFYGDYLALSVDQRIRIEQAIRILKGEE